ncbi:MAG: carbohydrate isomerase, partial [Longicatena sp.]
MVECIKDYLQTMEHELGKSIASLDIESVQKAAKIIIDSEQKGGRVHVTGIGKPGHVAGYVASLL